MKRIFLISSLLLIFSLVGFWGGCGYPKPINPPTLTYPTDLLTRLSAEARAKDIGGILFYVLDTHSMEPTLKGGDYIVVDKRRVFDSVKAGEIGTYVADWYALHPITHRFATKDKDGWIMSGDNTKNSESRWRVTAKTYIGVVDGIYRVKP